MPHRDWLGLKKALPDKLRFILTVLSFVLPVSLWCAVSYLPFLWHPLTRITEPGSIEHFIEGMEVPNREFANQVEKQSSGGDPPGVSSQPGLSTLAA